MTYSCLEGEGVRVRVWVWGWGWVWVHKYTATTRFDLNFKDLVRRLRSVYEETQFESNQKNESSQFNPKKWISKATDGHSVGWVHKYTATTRFDLNFKDLVRRLRSVYEETQFESNQKNESSQFNPKKWISKATDGHSVGWVHKYTATTRFDLNFKDLVRRLRSVYEETQFESNQKNESSQFNPKKWISKATDGHSVGWVHKYTATTRFDLNFKDLVRRLRSVYEETQFESNQKNESSQFNPKKWISKATDGHSVGWVHKYTATTRFDLNFKDLVRRLRSVYEETQFESNQKNESSQFNPKKWISKATDGHSVGWVHKYTATTRFDLNFKDLVRRLRSVYEETQFESNQKNESSQFNPKKWISKATDGHSVGWVHKYTATTRFDLNFKDLVRRLRSVYEETQFESNQKNESSQFNPKKWISKATDGHSVGWVHKYTATTRFDLNFKDLVRRLRSVYEETQFESNQKNESSQFNPKKWISKATDGHSVGWVHKYTATTRFDLNFKDLVRRLRSVYEETQFESNQKNESSQFNPKKWISKATDGHSVGWVHKYTATTRFDLNFKDLVRRLRSVYEETQFESNQKNESSQFNPKKWISKATDGHSVGWVHKYTATTRFDLNFKDLVRRLRSVYEETQFESNQKNESSQFNPKKWISKATDGHSVGWVHKYTATTRFDLNFKDLVRRLRSVYEETQFESNQKNESSQFNPKKWISKATDGHSVGWVHKYTATTRFCVNLSSWWVLSFYCIYFLSVTRTFFSVWLKLTDAIEELWHGLASLRRFSADFCVISRGESALFIYSYYVHT